MATKTIDITIPDAAKEGTELVVAAWLKQEGDAVSLHEPLVEISTDKVTVEVPSPAAGVLVEVLKDANEAVTPADVLGRIDPKADASSTSKGSTSGSSSRTPETSRAAPAPSSDPAGTQAANLSPAVRRLVREHGVDVTQVPGSGRGGRVTARDVEAFVARGGGNGSGVTRDTPRETPRMPAKVPLVSRRVPHSPMRRNIADHMVRSALQTAPHVTAVFDADLSAVLRHREANRADFERRGVNLTLTAYFVVAAVEALKTVPEANSRWHESELELFGDCNVGVATALDNGLIVPVIRHAQSLDLFGVAGKLADMIARARSGRLDLDEVQGGTFTITNHGVSGSLIATPIINQPQSAILGIGKLEKRVVVVDADGTDALQIRPMVYVTLTIDHRVLDGFKANQFLSAFVHTLEHWA